MGAWLRREATAGAVTLLAFTLGCNQVASEPDRPAQPAANESHAAAPEATPTAAAAPADTDLTQVGPGGNTRVYYQFVDERGSVRFVERLEDVPATWRDSAGFVEMDSPPPLSPLDARRTRDRRAGEGTKLTVAARPDVILYYADWCGYCRRAKAHLNDRRVPYELRDVDTPAAKRELLAKTGSRGIPALDVGGRILKGYSEGGYDELLASAGF